MDTTVVKRAESGEYRERNREQKAPYVSYSIEAPSLHKRAGEVGHLRHPEISLIPMRRKSPGSQLGASAAAHKARLFAGNRHRPRSLTYRPRRAPAGCVKATQPRRRRRITSPTGNFVSLKVATCGGGNLEARATDSRLINDPGRRRARYTNTPLSLLNNPPHPPDDSHAPRFPISP
ncbi:hypothetical protein EVAR_52160_1 [Eumeta japonica]|uniref:Uncharacterized protein n=1 Tax=Eumeta variegata TaxID=151549 RepID=A0A4C1YBG7_EUMVA|nr:hypothetical protein EVAR_52160_1 [Eumeta japonica]